MRAPVYGECIACCQRAVAVLILFSQVMTIVQLRYRRLPERGRLGVFSFKKDRGFWLEKLADGHCRLSEFGFRSDCRMIAVCHLEAELKPVIKLEFPRSYKLHLVLEAGTQTHAGSG